MNTRRTGDHYEEAVAAYLTAQGIRIVERNVVCAKIGEIDMIGVDEDADALVFIEVKYRKNHNAGYPAEAVDQKKVQKIRRCAQYYLAGKPTDRYIRFDVVAVEGEEIAWYKNAF